MAEFDPNKPFELEAPAEFDSNKPFELEAPAEFDSNKPFELEKSVNSDDLNEPSTDEGWAKELGEGVVEGLTKIPQGIIELGLEGVDYVADTQNARQFNLWADKTRKDFGIDPEGAVGTIASGLTQFAVPGLGAASVVSKLSKLGKLKKGYAQGKNFGFGLTKTQKVALATQQAVAAGVADAVVTTDGTQTIGDFFDGGFTGTDVYNVADSGSEDAARRIGNRFSMLIEGGALAGTIPPVLSGIGKGLVKAGSSNLSGVPQVSKVINAGLEKATKYVAKLDELDMSQGLKNEETGETVRKMTAFENFNFFLARNLRSRGALLGAKKGVQKQETNRSIKIFDKDTNEEILFNGEKRSFKSEEEAYANFREMVNEEVKQLPEWRSIEETITRGAKDSPEYKDLQYQRMRNADNPNIDSDLIDQQQRIINKELTDAQDEILQQNYLTREQKTKTISMDVSKGVAGTEETIDTAKLFSLIGPVQEAAFKVATDQFQRLEKQIDKVLAQPKYLKQSNLSKEKILNNLYDYFTGKTIVSEDNLFKEIGIPKELEIPIKNMVKLKNNLAEKILKSGAVKNLLSAEDIINKVPRPKNEAVYTGGGSPPKNWKGTVDEWKDQKFVEFKRRQGLPVKEDIIRSIEDSMIKPDGTHKGGFFVTRYRIMEDNNYKLTADTVDNVMGMFGFKKNANEKFVLSGNKNLFDEKTMQNMYKNIAKTFNPRRKEIDESIKKLEFNNQPVPQKLLDERELLKFDAVNKKFEKPSARQVKQYIDMAFNNQKAKQDIARSNKNSFFIQTAMQKIPTTLINTKKLDLPSLKAIYGEVKDLKESYVGTITKFAQFNATDNFYTSLRKIADDDIAKNGNNSIFKNTNEMRPDELREFTQSIRGQNSFVLGKQGTSGRPDELSLSETPYGAMHGIAIPSSMWKSMSQNVINDTNSIGHVGRLLYGKFLWLKGFSQYSKTILSPITHVRNVTSASLFALAQGNVGRGANLGESLKYVSNDLLGRSDEEQVAFLADLQRRGIIGSQAELRELQANLRKGVGYENPKTGDSNLQSNLNGSSMVFNLSNKFTRGAGKVLKKMEDAYKGEDDIWKIYNYQFELNKLKTARARYVASAKNADEAKAFTKEFDDIHLDGKSMEDFAGDIVRNHVPNYDLASDAIKSFRQLPVGNFVSFPAEIIRTGFNTLETAMKELSSNIPEVREIGMRRLMGSLTTFIALPVAVREMGMSLSGTSEEEMQAVQDLAAPWQKNSVLVPVGRDKNGHLEVYDFSHTNPYDILIAPFTAVIRSLDRDGKLGRDGIETAMNAAESSFTEMFQPFFDESIITAKLLDIAPKALPGGRGGATETGARIYKTGEGGDSMGSRYQKGFIHVLEGLTPGGSPFRVPTGAGIDDIEMGRFLRGITQPEDSKEPSTGRQYTLAGEFVRATLGVNTQTFDWDRLGMFKAQEFKSNRSTAATLFNKVNNKAVVSSEDYIEAWTDANRARLRSFRAARKDFLSLMALGATEDQVVERWKKEGVGNKEIGAIIENSYIPFFPSRDAFITAEEKGNIMPEDELEELYDSFDGVPIDPVEEEVDEGFIEQSQNSVQTPKPVVTNTPTTPVVKTSQTSPVARDINTRLATLLNPNDRIIAERQRNIG
tara:strand:- start:311 stop:5200 length:4890 start_codon:yes stop_codon:yes gene_type:complete